MRISSLLTAWLLCFLFAAGAIAAQPTFSKSTAATNPSAGLDAAAKEKLVGEHMLTVQWLGYGDLSKAGIAIVKDRGKTLSMKGKQIGQGENAGDYLKISGKIVSADQNSFVFVGKITIKAHNIANGKECERNGTFTFKTSAGRKYWRLQEMQNPCDGVVVDYVDVYFRGI